MTQDQCGFHKRRGFLFTTGAAALSTLWGCGNQNSEVSLKAKEIEKPFKMGERAGVGLLTYNILESTYFTQLGTVASPKFAEKRFLVLRMAITNGGAKEMDIPLFNLLDEAGQVFPELQQAEFVRDWFGLIRKVGPSMTEEGRLVFDVAPKNYKLQVTDGGETGKEQFAYIEIPLEFDTAEPIPSAGQGSGTPPTKK